ncbi:MAG: hypothetical protein M1816_006163 [Peltula sp. TS41687]|nr:MAG: hypothetical protein M1816_006163 [Peltula sp. TS41687]
MATTPTPKSRASLIREMADELGREHRSAAPQPTRANRGSPTGSVGPIFDPANEAIVSTSQVDPSEYSLPPLAPPEVPVSAGPGQPQKRYFIDTSAIGRVFPDWAGSSSGDSTVSSIETGRGKKNEIRVFSNPVRHLEEFSSDLHPYTSGTDAEPLTKGAAAKPKPTRISSTLAQVLSAKKATKEHDMKEQTQQDLFAVENKENQRPTSPTAKSTGNGPRPTTVGNGAPRRTLAEMHARVRDEDDESILSEERPPTLDLTSRSTRFSRPNSRLKSVNPPAPSTNNNKDDLNLKKPAPSKSISGRSPQKYVIDQATPAHNASANATYQSYVLPDLPNLSELVSGVYEDGTPVFSRRVSRASRYGNHWQYHHHPDDDVDEDGEALAYDERAILISLRVLQDKVVELEREKAGREKTMEELQNQVETLKVEKEQLERRRRSDSALGSGDSGSEAGDDLSKLKHTHNVEKAKLEQMHHVLQDRLDAANRKVSVADLAIKNLTRERDSADARLGLAYISNEKLQHENKTLSSEIETLKKHLARILEEHEDEKRELSKRNIAVNAKLQHENQTLRSEVDVLKKHLAQTLEEHEAEKQELGEKDAAFNDKLQHENQTLRSELNALKKHLAQVLEKHEAEKQEFCKREAAAKQRLELRDEAVNKLRDMTRNLYDLRKPSHSVQEPPTQGVAGNHTAPANEAEGKSHTQPLSNTVQPKNAEAQQGNADQQPVIAQPEVPKKKRTRTVIVEETIHSDISEPDHADQTGTENLNNLYRADDEDALDFSDDTSTGQMSRSFLLPEQLEKLQKIVEEVKATQQAQEIQAAPVKPAQGEVRHVNKASKPAVVEEQAPLLLKPSLKPSAVQPKVDTGAVEDEEHTGKLSIRAGENTEQRTEERAPADDTRHSKATSSRRRRRAGSAKGAVNPYTAEENMTSAYILPDITIRVPSTQPIFSSSAQCVCSGLPPHDVHNCTVCHVISSNESKPAPNKTDTSMASTKNVIKIPKPIPVSERMPEPVPYEDEPTIRPSQPPAIALAVVMKALEDELSHLKLVAAKYQAAYNNHDASLGKHKRKMLCKKLGLALNAVDTKADQIYALYDVLEGQKKDGHVMSEHEIEVTLHSIGLDLAELTAKPEKTPKKESGVVRNIFDGLSGSSDEEELPWEGFEDTTPVSRAGSVSRSRRSSLRG